MELGCGSELDLLAGLLRALGFDSKHKCTSIVKCIFSFMAVEIQSKLVRKVKKYANSWDKEVTGRKGVLQIHKASASTGGRKHKIGIKSASLIINT